MSITGIHGQLLEVTVVSGYKLKDTEWISRQDPYVCLEYGNTKFRTRTCTDGGKNPTFQEKFMFTLIEGLRELSITVWNSNTLSVDDFIGSGKVQLHRAFSTGFDDSCWPLQTKTGRNAGEIKLILYYADANKASSCYAPSAPPYMLPGNSQAPLYPMLPPTPASSYPPPPSAPCYPPPASVNPYPYSASSPYPSYSGDCTSSLYPPPLATYPPSPYPPTSVYPPSPYPPPPGSAYYPPGTHSGMYPPPPY